MDTKDSRPKRRLGIVINHFFLLMTILAAVGGETLGWSMWITSCFWLSMVVTLATFPLVHIRTGLWRLAHAKVDTLDERELQLILESLRYSYGFFSITALSTILVMVVFGCVSPILQLVVFWGLLYLAHTLPSSIIAWTLIRVPAQTEE